MVTIRQQIIDLLSEGDHDIRELSVKLRIKEKEIYPHLQHVGKSLAHKNRELRIIPAVCHVVLPLKTENVLPGRVNAQNVRRAEFKIPDIR